MAIYYVDATDGDDAKDGLSPANAWQTIAKVNGETFNAGDQILFQCGEIWREQLTVPSSGASVNPIIFSAYGSGSNPILNGSDLVVTWSDEGGDVWSASFTPAGSQSDIAKVFLDGTLGTKVASQPEVDAENEWFYDTGTDTLYVYSAGGDPDTEYTSPGIEALSRDQCIWADDKSYITIDGIDCTKANLDGIKIEGTGHTHIVKNLTLSHTGFGQGLLTAEQVTNPYVYKVVAHDCGVDNQDHGFYFGAPTQVNGTLVVERCVAYNNGGYGFHLWNSGGGVVRYCSGYGNEMSAFLAGDLGDNANVDFEYCISYSNTRYGFHIYSNGTTYNGNNTIRLFNCVGYKNEDWFANLYIQGNGNANTTIIAKNCAWEHAGVAPYCLRVEDDGNLATITLDYNLYYSPSGTMIRYEADLYTQAQFATYQSEKSQDANGKSAAPLFVDGDNGDWHLQSGSPCLDSGDDVGLTVDYGGISVPQETNPAIGAYEYSLLGRHMRGMKVQDSFRIKL